MLKSFPNGGINGCILDTCKCNEGEKILNIMLGRGNKQVVLTIRFTTISAPHWETMKRTISTYADAARSHDKAMRYGRILLDTLLNHSFDYFGGFWPGCLLECIEIVKISFHMRPSRRMLWTQLMDRGELFNHELIRAIHRDYNFTSFDNGLDGLITTLWTGMP